MRNFRKKLLKLLLLNIMLVLGMINASAQEDPNTVWDIELSPDGLQITTVTTSSIIISDAAGNIVTSLPGHEGINVAAAWSPDGTLLATGGNDNFIRLWTTGDWNLVHEVEVPASMQVFNLSWQPQGNLLLASGFDALWVWDTTSWTLVVEPTAFQITDVMWSPDGGSFAVTGTPANVGIVTLVDGALDVRVLEGHSATPYSLDWHPDGKRLVSAGGQDGTVRLWDVATGGEVATLLQVDGIVTDVVFMDAQIIAASTEQGDVYTIDTESAEILDTQSVGGSVTDLLWNPNNQRLAISQDSSELQSFSSADSVDSGLPLVFRDVDLSEYFGIESQD